MTYLRIAIVVICLLMVCYVGTSSTDGGSDASEVAAVQTPVSRDWALMRERASREADRYSTTTAAPKTTTTTRRAKKPPSMKRVVTATPTTQQSGFLPYSDPLPQPWQCIHMREAVDWHNRDTGHNGHWGGFQFSLATWHSVGGAGNPADATPQEQFYRAQVLQRRSGYGQWSTARACAA